MNGSILKITALTPQLEMEITNLLNEAGVRSRCMENGEVFATFDSKERLTGLACAGRYGEDCLIHFVVVRSDVRSRGTGSALVNHVLGYFAGRCDRAYVAAGNAGGFFEQFGFTAVAHGELPESVSRAQQAAVSESERRDVERAMKFMLLELPGRWTIP
jgi:N-acetylglutamate synthase-like GNAT family acetyltransferase